MVRRSSSFNTARMDHLYGHPKLHLHYGDITDGSALTSLVGAVQPVEIYHLAAQSHVKVSFDTPEHTGQTNAMGTVKLLEALRTNHLLSSCKFYNASSSEMYGGLAPSSTSSSMNALNEMTPFAPRSPYAISKLYAHHMVVNYREAYHLFACNGILFNHESPRRGPTFVTKKIVRAAVRMRYGKQKLLRLGNLSAMRD
uniref:GDP-mannose 4,6-dehydratase n=1 Tax=Lygus hesperus TaxID=30085 RepID=A0A0A9YWI4_LYGHE